LAPDGAGERPGRLRADAPARRPAAPRLRLTILGCGAFIEDVSPGLVASVFEQYVGMEFCITNR